MKRTQRGDTIVEVMLAMAVIGMVIGFSYSTAARALRTGRYAQEQTEALKLAETQIERLKYINSLSDDQKAIIYDTTDTAFCIDESFGKISQTDVSGYADGCTNVNDLYTILVTYSADTTDTFTVKVTWTAPIDTQDGTVQIAYRMHS